MSSIPPSAPTGGSEGDGDKLLDNREKPFKLGNEVTVEYPALANLPQETALSVSAVFHNNRTVADYIESAKKGEPTGNIGYHLKFIEECLSQLDGSSDPNVIAFAISERVKFLKLQNETSRVIAGKKRGADGVYRSIEYRKLARGGRLDIDHGRVTQCRAMYGINHAEDFERISKELAEEGAYLVAYAPGPRSVFLINTASELEESFGERGIRFYAVPPELIPEKYFSK